MQTSEGFAGRAPLATKRSPSRSNSCISGFTWPRRRLIAHSADDAFHRQRGRPCSLVEKGRRLHILASGAPLGDNKRFGTAEPDIAAEEVNANQHGRNQTKAPPRRQSQQKRGERFDTAVPVSILIEARHTSPHLAGENRGQGLSVSGTVEARIRPGKIIEQKIDAPFPISFRNQTTPLSSAAVSPPSSFLDHRGPSARTVSDWLPVRATVETGGFSGTVL